MDRLKAETEIHDAWANVVLAGIHLTQDKYADATEALSDAEFHYVAARSCITITDSGPVLDKLNELRAKLDQVGSVIGSRSAAKAAVGW